MNTSRACYAVPKVNIGCSRLALKSSEIASVREVIRHLTNANTADTITKANYNLAEASRLLRALIVTRKS